MKRGTGAHVLRWVFFVLPSLWFLPSACALEVISVPLRIFGSGSIWAVAISPDGNKVMACGKTVKLWDSATGRELRTFSGHVSEVDSVAFSPDGSKVLTGSADMTAKLWDVDTGKELHTYMHSAWVSSVAFSPNGTNVLTGSWNTTAKLWDVATGQSVQTFTGHTAEVWSVAFSPNGSNVLTGSADNTAKLWDVATGQPVQTFMGVDPLGGAELPTAVDSPRFSVGFGDRRFRG